MNPGFMNNDLVNSDPHKRARLMIALSGPEHISNRERSWLAAHLESCQSCREFAESTGEAIRFIKDLRDPYFRKLYKDRSMYLSK